MLAWRFINWQAMEQSVDSEVKLVCKLLLLRSRINLTSDIAVCWHCYSLMIVVLEFNTLCQHQCLNSELLALNYFSHLQTLIFTYLCSRMLHCRVQLWTRAAVTAGLWPEVSSPQFACLLRMSLLLLACFCLSEGVCVNLFWSDTCLQHTVIQLPRSNWGDWAAELMKMISLLIEFLLWPMFS